MYVHCLICVIFVDSLLCKCNVVCLLYFTLLFCFNRVDFYLMCLRHYRIDRMNSEPSFLTTMP